MFQITAKQKQLYKSNTLNCKIKKRAREFENSPRKTEKLPKTQAPAAECRTLA